MQPIYALVGLFVALTRAKQRVTHNHMLCVCGGGFILICHAWNHKSQQSHVKTFININKLWENHMWKTKGHASHVKNNYNVNMNNPCVGITCKNKNHMHHIWSPVQTNA